MLALLVDPGTYFAHVIPVYEVDVRILATAHSEVPDDVVGVLHARQDHRSARAKVVILGGQVNWLYGVKVVRDRKIGRQLQERVSVVAVLRKPVDKVGIKRAVAGRAEDEGWIIGGCR